MPFVIRKIGVNAFFTECVRVGNTRLQHFDLAAKFLYLTRVNGIAATKRQALDEFVLEFKRFRDQGRLEATLERINELQAETEAILTAMTDFFLAKDTLLDSQGRMVLYFHIFRIHRKAGTALVMTREMLEQFNEGVVAARRKSQRRSRGSAEVLTPLEMVLVQFDQEKQSTNDASALTRQYVYMAEYCESVFHIRLPAPD